MPLPGVRTVLKDQFRTVSRSQIPDGVRVAGVARRNNSPEYEGAADDYAIRRISSEENVVDYFGEHSEAHRCYLDLVSGGAARVWIVGLPKDLENSELGDEEVLEEVFGQTEANDIDIVAFHGRGWHPYDNDEEFSDEDPPDYGFAADGGDGNLVDSIASWCETVSMRSNPCFAVLGVAPASHDKKDVPVSDLKEHLKFENLPERSEVSSYVSVIATEVLPVNRFSEVEAKEAADEFQGEDDNKHGAHYFTNGAAMYAGLIAALDAEQAPTGRTMFNVDGMRWVPTRTQAADMIEKGLVPLGLNQNRTPRVIDGQTFGKDDSDYRRLSTLRIVFDAIQLTRRAAEKFVGEPATLHNRNALETDITSKLRGMVVNGALVEADFDVEYLPRENRALVELVLTPAFEFRNIDVKIAIDL